MNFNVPSFAVGAGAALAVMMVGFGGGVLVSGALTDGPRAPNKIERQAAKESNETKPAHVPVPVPPAAAAPTQAAVAPPPAAPPNPAPAESSPQPAVQAQPAPPPAQPAPVPQASSPQTAQTESLGPQKPVALVQPSGEEQLRPGLSRREEARLRAQQRREERAQRREERRQLIAERRHQEQMRRAEMRSAERLRRQEADDDEPPVMTRRERPFDLPFFRMFGGG